MGTNMSKHVISESGLIELEKVRKICLYYPEVEEALDSFGHISFRVKDKPLCNDGTK